MEQKDNPGLSQSRSTHAKEHSSEVAHSRVGSTKTEIRALQRLDQTKQSLSQYENENAHFLVKTNNKLYEDSTKPGSFFSIKKYLLTLYHYLR
jgi:hypothetical protein